MRCSTGRSTSSCLENYRFEFQLRGETGPQNLELKLVDETARTCGG
jgi:hypothetical protein